MTRFRLFMPHRNGLSMVVLVLFTCAFVAFAGLRGVAVGQARGGGFGGRPSIQVTGISQKQGKIAGVVRGLGQSDRGDYRVVVLVRTDVYYPHPYLDSYAGISADGTWEVDHIVRGNERGVAAVLVPKGAKLALLDRQGWVKSLQDLQPVAAAEVKYEPEYTAKPSEADSAQSPAGDQSETPSARPGGRVVRSICIASGDRPRGRVNVFQGRGGSASYRVWRPRRGTNPFYGLTFNRPPRGFCGWYVDFLRQPVDASQMTALSLYVRGASGGEKVRVGLKDVTIGPDAAAISSDPIELTTSWQKVEIPLDEFKRLDTRRVASCVIEPIAPSRGTIYFDSIRFVETEPAPPEPPAAGEPADVPPPPPENGSASAESSAAHAHATLDDAQPAPVVLIDSVSASKGVIQGRVQKLRTSLSQHVVVCYVKSDVWYVHPKVGETSRIADDGSWQIEHIPRGEERELAVLLADEAFVPPNQIGSLEALDVVAIAKIPYEPEYRAPEPPTVSFAGRKWIVKTGQRHGPGPNAWSEDGVWVDEQGLHLNIRENDGTWFCTEVIASDPLGYGTYTWVISGDLQNLDPRAVLGLFLYRDDRHEIDFELSRWGQADADNAQFIVQAARAGKQRFGTGDATTLTVSIYWNEDMVRGRCWVGEDTSKEPLADWEFPSPQVPRDGGELARANFWLMSGKPPTNGEPQEIVIRSFAFEPAP